MQVAVHCHAGLGRTGLVCAAYLMYSLGLSAHEVSQCSHSARQSALQRRVVLRRVRLVWVGI